MGRSNPALEVNVGQFDQNQVRSHKSWVAWAVVLTAALFFFYEFIILNIFNSLNESLVREFGITEAQMGNLSAFYMYANLLLLFPAGIIIDHVSTRRIILIAMSICVSSTFVFSYAPSFFVAELCRFAMGIGGAFCLLSAVRLASRWFEANHMALAVGMVVTLAFIGGMLAQLAHIPIAHFGWRTVIFSVACAGLVMLAAIYFVVRDFPPGYKKAHPGDISEELPFWTSIRLAVSNRQNWLAGLYTCLFNLPVFVFGAFAGGIYLEQVFGMDISQASYICSMIYFGTILGSPAIGWLSDRIGLRKSPMIVFGLLSLATLLLILYGPHWSYYSLMALFFLLGFFTSAQIISYPLIAESNSKSITGAATGVGSTVIMAGGLSMPIAGWLLEYNWGQKVVDGHRIYALSDFHLAFSILPVAFVIGLIAAAFLRETRCVAKD